MYQKNEDLQNNRYNYILKCNFKSINFNCLCFWGDCSLEFIYKTGIIAECNVIPFFYIIIIT